MTHEPSVFRPEALERLSSPEQLDQLMEVTPPRTWLLVAGFALVVAAAASWSVFGALVTTVTGHGLLVQDGGVLEVSALGSGQLLSLHVDVGDTVEKGQVIARLSQPELQQAIEVAQLRLREQRERDRQLSDLGEAGVELRSSFIVQQRRALQGAIRADEERLKWLREYLVEQGRLANQGLVTRTDLQATRQEIDATNRSLRESFAQLRSLSADRQEVEGQREREQLASQLRINEAERALLQLEAQLEHTSRILSPHSGRVIEIRSSVGELVGPGHPIVNLEPEERSWSGLRALLFVPLDQGKRLSAGMRARIAPASVRREEAGEMHAIVTAVSEFPSTQEGMERKLENPLLVQNLLDRVGLAPIAVEAELVPNPDTPSGYAWTSRRGAAAPLGPGTPCEARIIVEARRPIERLLPFLSRLLDP